MTFTRSPATAEPSRGLTRVFVCTSISAVVRSSHIPPHLTTAACPQIIDWPIGDTMGHYIPRCQVHEGDEGHARPGWTTSRRGQDSLWKSQSEWQRTGINRKSTSIVWPTVGSRTAKRTEDQVPGEGVYTGVCMHQSAIVTGASCSCRMPADYRLTDCWHNGQALNYTLNLHRALYIQAVTVALTSSAP